MKFRLAILVCSLLVGGLFFTAPGFAAQAQSPDPQATPVDSTEPDAATAELAGLLENALQNRIDSLAPLIFDVTIDHIVFSSDGQVAALWVAMRDPQTGEVLATEPSLVIANRSAPDAGWSLTLPPDEGFVSALTALPEELISSELRETFLAEVLDLDEPDGQVFRGYLLPWAGGLSKRLSGSIGHYLIYNSCSEYYCRYAYDFADGTMFPLLAAKGGEVYRFYDGCANGSTDCSNYIVLKDNSTEPVTYQTYLHLAYNTIPAELKSQGTQVLQGQYIGNVDDTGYSSGHHLHFHVFTTPTSTYWGPSVDIIFDDVSINGGRPRTCYEAANWPSLGSQCQDGDAFTSGNFGANPPTATLTLPVQGEVIGDGSLLVAGTASDDLGVTRVQAMAKIDGEWVPIGSSQVLSGAKSVSYILDIDLCDAGVPNGPLDVAVRVWDYEGNYSLTAQSPRTVIDNTVCLPEPPACQPAANQVALYSGPNYTGACRVLGLGTYASASSFSPVADNSLSSLLVGDSVEAILYEAVSTGGRSETIIQDDANLADNRIGTNRMSSIRVAERTLEISEPTLSAPFNVTTASITSADSLVLDWAAPGAVSFEATLSGPLSLTQAYSDSNAWSVGSLPAGDYTWTVKAKTVTGAVKTNSATFTVADTSLPSAPAITVPASQVEDTSGWTATTAGLWHWVTDYTLDGRTADAWVYNDGTDVGSSTVGASDLTSPPFTVPSGPAWLAFDYTTQTESDTPYWDQRWVQVSVEGGRFENLLQLSGERMATWLSSPWIDLSAYAGQSVRLRFHFDIVDKYYNGDLPEGGVVRGWAIDNVRVFSASLPACAESSNDAPGTATAINIGAPLAASICSPGDVDYYRFSAAAGQRIGAELTANGAALELALFAPDGRSLLDSSPNSVGLVAVEAGDYYLRVRAEDHPGVGSASDTYTLNLIQDSIPPSMTLLSPASSWLPASHATLVVQASDSDSGVARVEFLWHSPDWQNGDWVTLVTDSDGSDGWTGSFDPSALSNFEGSALAAQAFDFAGNSWTVARFNLKIDVIAPVSQLQTLPAVTYSTAVNLQWSASDASGEMARFELQVDEGNDGSWQMLDAAVPGTGRNYWYIGLPGATYAFRIRAIDAAGNAESFPTAAEAVTTLATDCSGDEYEEDDSAGSAKSLTLEAAPQIHSLCGSNDPDWVQFSLPDSQDLWMVVNSRSGGAAVRVSLYASGDTVNALATAQSGGVGKGVVLSWTAFPAGDYLLKIEPLRADVFGTDAKYSLWVGEPRKIYLPVVWKN